MNNKEFAEYLGISEPTIYSWKKHKKNLYDIVMQWKNGNLNNLSSDEEKLLKIFKELNEKQKKYYLLKMESDLIQNEMIEEKYN
ncbi:hypothetical protein [Sulfurospirillum halorespirans]|uniref:Uncharacterized protein n=1 Tax=Sulfurospirillum halorespirans DSM 13726 TaxID=1193502 RepID=A0A1D7THW7_9BACT|nr:hypothetical protein [Sulfurospirillum halorespirans]AOO64566.1 hypothetical protein SHALO_0784 [Sulfurospirillum halorespirans DSM 13726]